MDKETQYRQLDFLRLFKLCKEMDIVKRKRKMPVESEGNTKNAGKRLLSSLISVLFPDMKINTEGDNFRLNFSQEARDALSQLANKPRSYFDNAGEEGAVAFRRYETIKQSFRGHVIPIFPYEIRISISSNDASDKYVMLARAGVETARPTENYYTCAKACIEYKNIWYENISSLITFFSLEEGRQKEREAEQMKFKLARRQAMRLKLEQEKKGSESKKMEDKSKVEQEKKKLEEKVQKEKVEKITNAQQLFNERLEEYKQRQANRS